MHILVVEDDLEIQKSLKIFLENEGYDVTLVGDGLQALTVFDEQFDFCDPIPCLRNWSLGRSNFF